MNNFIIGCQSIDKYNNILIKKSCKSCTLKYKHGIDCYNLLKKFKLTIIYKR